MTIGTRSSGGMNLRTRSASVCLRSPAASSFGTGLTPHQYIIRCRLERAMKLLSQSEMRLAEIAVEVGCCCQSHLTALFRKHLNTTPGS
jgi:AraC-like DNA-binding protein